MSRSNSPDSRPTSQIPAPTTLHSLSLPQPFSFWAHRINHTICLANLVKRGLDLFHPHWASAQTGKVNIRAIALWAQQLTSFVLKHCWDPSMVTDLVHRWEGRPQTPALALPLSLRCLHFPSASMIQHAWPTGRVANPQGMGQSVGPTRNP